MPLIKYVILIYILIFSLNNIYASEGFYFYDDIPKNITGLAKSNTIEKTLLASGAFSLKRDRKLNKIDTHNYFIQKCKDPRISLWFESDCKKVNECISSKVENCNFESVSYCSGVVVEINNKTYFATAKHCGTSSPLFKAKFLSKNKKSIIEVPLVKTPQSEKSLPYDIALYDIPNWISLNRKAVKLSFKISNNEPVYSVGFPFTVYRTEKNGQYSDAYNDMRLSFGKILDSNIKKKSFCHLSNDDQAKLSQMTLESTCLEHGEHTHKVTVASGQSYSYKAREERNITIADSDMAQGMSGAPLFNINGDLIGIASTVIVDAFPYNYKRSLGSVYSKSENILELLK